MPEATNVQMQTFADTRVRVFAEQFRALIAAARDHKSSIDDVYARAVGGSRWNDARTDGPPHLLQSGNSASPDDMLTFNAVVSDIIDIIDNVGDQAAKCADLRTTWAILVDACVRPLGV